MYIYTNISHRVSIRLFPKIGMDHTFIHESELYCLITIRSQYVIIVNAKSFSID